MQVIFVGVVIAAYVIQWGAAIAVVFAHAQAKASDDARLALLAGAVRPAEEASSMTAR